MERTEKSRKTAGKKKRTTKKQAWQMSDLLHFISHFIYNILLIFWYFLPPIMTHAFVNHIHLQACIIPLNLYSL